MRRSIAERSKDCADSLPRRRSCRYESSRPAKQKSCREESSRPEEQTVVPSKSSRPDNAGGQIRRETLRLDSQSHSQSCTTDRCHKPTEHIDVPANRVHNAITPGHDVPVGQQQSSCGQSSESGLEAKQHETVWACRSWAYPQSVRAANLAEAVARGKSGCCPGHQTEYQTETEPEIATCCSSRRGRSAEPCT